MASQNRKQHAKSRLDNLIAGYAGRFVRNGEPFWRLIHGVRRSSRLLVPLPERGRTDPRVPERIVRACARMAHRRDAWHRAPEVWIAPPAGPFVQFRSLVSHLFDQYPVPKFMAPVWMSEHDKPWELDMYLHLAAGRGIRQFKLPLPFRLSRRAAAHFMQAPDDLLPIAAMRWAHVRSLGGDDRLARLLASRTVLVAPTPNEEFWEPVIRFLVRHAPISADEIVGIIQFIHEQRFQPAETVWGRGAGPEPLQPEFTLRGRSLMSLRRHVANWRTELLAELPHLVPAAPAWPTTEIGAFRHSEGETLWTIDELLTPKQLRVEGGIMQHCVATYIRDCARRRTSIWSMVVHQAERRKRVLTIEVVPSARTICQARGKRNSPPSDTALLMLRRWAEQEGLRFAEAV